MIYTRPEAYDALIGRAGGHLAAGGRTISVCLAAPLIDGVGGGPGGRLPLLLGFTMLSDSTTGADGAPRSATLLPLSAARHVAGTPPRPPWELSAAGAQHSARGKSDKNPPPGKKMLTVARELHTTDPGYSYLSAQQHSAIHFPYHDRICQFPCHYQQLR